jgi:hypothetical protein
VKYSSEDEITFKYIVKGLIQLKKRPDEIIDILQSNRLCNREIIQKYDKLVSQILKYNWDSYNRCYILQESFIDTGKTYVSANEELKERAEQKSEEQNNDYAPLNNIIRNITNSQDGKIPYIEELKLACTLADDYQRIEVSQNDTATLLKNIACIESKLNEIARSVNTIATALNIARSNQDK